MGGTLVRITPEQRDMSMIEVEARHVACDGGGGALGHPLTYYEVGADGKATCGYCGMQFVLKDSAASAH